MTDARATARRRMSREERRAQLLAEARALIREAGTDTLTLGRVAQRAGVTKPVVYDHFGDRSGLLAELYREFEARQHEVLDAALESAGTELDDVAEVVAAAYIDCCVAEGRELADVVSALAGSPTLDEVRQEAEEQFLAKYRRALTPFAGEIEAADLVAILGAGDSLARAATTGSITTTHAHEVLARVIVSVTSRD
ncbi:MULTISPECIES: TetR/AcrR family transcriptional regulator [unclassified Dietzia]|uniref:TetR/AcrR family transcriptional regulator n=1 Tax=unclassified Dietzia TaxID=2617939 RepID=UPI001F50772E|nr:MULTISPECIES: TetR/AcrR family transcriptional regulator [unclassified Dietzia]